MQNKKWILISLVMTFFGIPILAQFLAAVIATLGATRWRDGSITHLCFCLLCVKRYTRRFSRLRYLDNSRTPEAYNKIVKGDADIIFVAQPSGGQKKRASLWYTPPLPAKHFFSSSIRIIIFYIAPEKSALLENIRNYFLSVVWWPLNFSPFWLQPWTELVGSISAQLGFALGYYCQWCSKNRSQRWKWGGWGMCLSFVTLGMMVWALR